MFEQNINQCSSSNEKNLILSFSLLMRLFEWCHEDAKDDVAMHKAMEKLVAFSDGVNPLTIDVYDCVISGANDGQESDKSEDIADDNDMKAAYDLGCQQAENGMDLSMTDYSDVGLLIASEKNNGYGASNAELEQFWNGYNGEPLKQGCFTELDINDAVNKVNHCYHNNELVNSPKMSFDKGFKQHDLRQQPTVITINGDEVPYCNDCAGEMLDSDTLQEIQNIINVGKF